MKRPAWFGVRRHRSRGQRKAAPRLEPLEDRWVPSLFTPPASLYGAGTAPQVVAVGNFDGSPGLDFVVTDQSFSNLARQGSLNVLLNNGDGTFGQAAGSPFNFSATDEFPEGVVAANLDGANNDDLVIAFNGGYIRALLNTGAGTFSIGPKVNAGGGTDAVLVNDFNQDGNTDAVASNFGAGTADVYPGNGNGTFGALLVLNGLSNPEHGVTPDFDGDGKPDLAIPNQAGANSVTVFRNTSAAGGALSFDTNNAINLQSGQNGPTGSATADFDGDGKPDLAVANFTSGSVSVWLNTSAGPGDVSFKAGGNLPVGNNAPGVVAADFNNDGRADLAASNGMIGGAGRVTVVLGNGDGTFGAPQNFNVGGLPVIMAAADLNGDSLPDLAMPVNPPGSNTNAGVLLNQAATATTVTSSGSPSSAGQSVTFTATVTPANPAEALTGSVTFRDGGTVLTANVPLAGNTAATTTSSLVSGSHTIKATYSGDSHYAGSSGTTTQQVNAAPTMATVTLTTSGSPSASGQPVTFTATVSGSGPTPTGTVQFFDNVIGALSNGLPLNNGTVSFTFDGLLIGTHTITAQYSGDAVYTAATSNAVTQQVSPFNSSTALATSGSPSTVGQAVTFTATVTGGGPPPTGTVTFLDGTTTLVGGVALNGNGQASFTTSSLTSGSHAITATYSGEPNHGASTSSAVTQQVNPASSTVTLATSGSPSATGQVVTFTATVTGAGPAPTGTITFRDGTTTVASNVALSGGAASFTTNALTQGAHSITAQYSGDASHAAAASAALTQQVNARSSTTALQTSGSPSGSGQAVTFTATVTGSGPTPTGSVTFRDGTAVLAADVALNGSGVATLTTSSLAAGTHSVTATYSGDANYGVSTSDAVTQTVQAAPPPPVHARMTAGVFDPSTATWYLRFSNSPGSPDVPAFSYGFPGVIPVAGDFDGDGKAGVGVYNPLNATWYLSDSGNQLTPFAFGLPGTLPLVADFDGDGRAGIGIYNPFFATWFLTDGGKQVAPVFAYGAPGWLPVVGDFDGDGKAGVGVFDPSTAVWYVSDSGKQFPPFAFGAPGWKPMVGDINGDGRADIGVFDPSTATWYLSDGNAVTKFQYGGANWTPLLGAWKGPDGQALLAADLPAPGTPPGAGLTPEALGQVRDAALARLAAAGLDAAGLARLRAVSVQVAALPGRLLGLETGNAIYLDRDAAGYGWFADPTPLRDEEFSGSGPLVATPGRPAAGRMDLLTAVEHEMGHALSLPDADAAGHPDDVMAGALAPGVRRVFAVDEVFALHGAT